LANGYLGMRSLLRVAQVWLDFPSNAPPTDTQLWHRDEDDYSTLKVFVYLTDVGESNGPFCFVPRSHPRDRDLAELTGYRDQDEQMAACVPRAEWLTCTGNAGTIIIADTRGYHRGLQPRTGHRALLTLQYTSGRPTYPPRVRVRGSHPTSLSPAQYAALHP
jgi:ectoine hydroxylase-related dioxygenase (phytanoyl-CoA dioxygenase family)